MEIVRSQCALVMPPIKKDCDRPRRVSTCEISIPFDQATSDEDRASPWLLDRDRAVFIFMMIERFS